MDISQTPSKTQARQKRQCWECLRRRLVCDFASPTCNKCRASGTVCPGYDHKPLKWLAPGKVTSRERKRRPAKSKENGSVGIVITTSSEEKATDEIEVTSQHIEKKVAEVTVPRHNLKTMAGAIFQAMCYYNSCVYPSYAPMHKLAPNPYIHQVPLSMARLFPPCISHTLVCFALSHRIYQILPNTDRSSLMEMRSSLYYHRGAAIRKLSEHIGKLETRTSDVTITSVMEFLFIDVRQSTLPNWREHFAGAWQLVLLRGGLKKLFQTSPYLKGALIYFMMIGVMGNTTSPPSDQIAATSDLDLIDLMSEMYGDGLFPVLLCPPYLFLDIININHLRYQATTPSFVHESTQAAAEVLLQHIIDFSPEQWAGPSATLRSQWILLGRIYQSAIILFCISSLQNLSVLCPTPRLEGIRIAHAGRLFLLLEEALVSPQIKKCMMWPLVVAGVEAVHGNLAGRLFVDKELTRMSQELGTPAPLLATSIFKRFWSSGKTGWDDCFDKPYAFGI